MNIPAQISETNEKLQSWWSEADVVKRVGVLGGVTVTFVIVLLLFTSALFFLWQYSKGEQVGKRIGFLLNIWGAVILFYLIMIVFL